MEPSVTASKLDNARRNLASSVAARMCSLVLPFVLRAVMLYTLGAEFLGLSGLFNSVFTFLCLADLGAGSAVVYLMYGPVASGDTDTVCALLGAYRKFCRVTGAVIIAAGAAVIPFLPRLICGEGPEGIRLAAVYLILLVNTGAGYFFFAWREALFRASQRLDVINYVELGTRLAADGLQIAVLLLTGNYYLYCLVFPLMTAVRNLAVAKLSRVKFPQYVCRGSLSAEGKEKLRKRMAGLLVGRISARFCYDLDSIVISAGLGLTVLAKYQSYQQVSYWMLVLVGMFGESIIPGIGNSLVTESAEKNYRDMNEYQLLYMWLNGWITACLVCLYQPFIRLWLGGDMLFPDAVLPFFGLYYLTLKMDDVCYQYRTAAGLWWEDRHRAVFAGVFNLVMDIVLVRRFGIAGVMAATILYQVVFDSFWGDRILFRNCFPGYSSLEFMKKRVYYMAVILLSCVLCRQACRVFPEAGGRDLYAVLLLLGRGLLCTALSNGCMWLFFRRTEDYGDAVSLARRLVCPGKNKR